MFKFLLVVPAAIKNGTSLSRLWQSQTTRSQIEGTVATGTLVAVLLAFLGNQFPETPLADPTTQLAILTVFMSLFGSLITRIVAFTKKPELMLTEDPAAWVFKVRKKEVGAWSNFWKTLLDAHDEGYGQAILLDGRVYDFQKNAVVDTLPLSPTDIKEVKEFKAKLPA